MIVAVADTHALIWHLLNDANLSPAAAGVLDGATVARQVAVSAISLAEIVYLEEKGRIAAGTLRAVRSLMAAPGPIAEVPLTGEIVEAMGAIPCAAVPDFPDRLIAATARWLKVPVVTRDERIRDAVETIW